MSEPLRTINLKCPSCGAALQIQPAMNHFSCGYCGAQQVVERSGGTVSLKLVTDAIARVQHGTDRTAAELAIVRLKHEIADLTAQRAALQQQWEIRRAQAYQRRSGCWPMTILFVLPLCLLPLVFVLGREFMPTYTTYGASEPSPVGPIVLLLGSGLVIVTSVVSPILFLIWKRWRDATKSAAQMRALEQTLGGQIRAVDAQLADRQRRMDHNRTIADGEVLPPPAMSHF